MKRRTKNAFLTQGDTFETMNGICGRFVALLCGNLAIGSSYRPSAGGQRAARPVARFTRKKTSCEND